MGLTRFEAITFCLGTGLFLRYLFRIVLPDAARRLEGKSSRISDTLREEFVHLPASRVTSLLLLAALLCASLAIAVSGSPAAAVACGAAPVLAAGTVIRWYRRRRRKKALSQLPILLDLLVGHLKAGHSLPESLSETVPLLPSGIREEMAWVLQKHRLGTRITESFELLEERMPSEDVSLFVRPLRAALSGGGNIVDLLEQTRDILRRKNRAQERLRSMTAQARFQAAVLTLLTPSFAAALSWIDPTFLPNLTETPQGKAILFTAVILQALGWATIRKILSVRP